MHRASPPAPALRLARALVPVPAGARLRLAAVVAVVTLGAAAAADRLEPDRRPLDVLAVVLLLASAAFVAGSGLPVWRAAGAAAPAAGYVAAGYPLAAEALAPAVVLVGCVVADRARAAVVVGVLAVLGAAVGSAVSGRPPAVAAVGAALAAVVAVVALADGLRMRRDLERGRQAWVEQGRQRRLADERVRIVRDVHAHVVGELGAMSRRARLARHLIDTYDHRAQVEARAALEELSSRGADAVAELRVVTALLDEDGAEALPRTPPRGLGGVPELVLAHLDTGLAVGVSGDAGRLPRAVDRCAYEVVAAALDNVCRHSTAVRAQVEVSREREIGGDVVVVRVIDGGPPRPARTLPVRGGTLAEVDARVRTLGGTLFAGPHGTRGWLVRVAIPVPA